MTAKGPQPHPHPEQLPTPATPLAPNQGTYAAVPTHGHTHPMGVASTSGGVYIGNVPSMGYTGSGQPRVTGSTGSIQGRPRTTPISSPSPTPMGSNRTLGGPSGSLPRGAPYTTSHMYHQPSSGMPMSTAGAHYSAAAGNYPSSTYGSPGVGGTGYSTGATGGRGIRGTTGTPYGSTGGGRVIVIVQYVICVLVDAVLFARRKFLRVH